MYLVSIYFDEKTNRQIQRCINLVADSTGNRFMTDGNVPPHITVSAFEARNEQEIVRELTKVTGDVRRGDLKWVSVGQFFPYVMFLTPVLNGYLHDMSEKIYSCISKVQDVKVSPYYRPYEWLPHTTIGKQLSQEEMKVAFEVMQKHFSVFEGTAVEIGLARTNPYRDVKRWRLV